MDEAGDSTFPNWPELRRLFSYDELVGKVLQGRYEVLRRLGAGGMGVVFLARHVHLDKLFALKIISARFLDEPEIGRRFLLEAQAASKIDHPNVVGITDFGPPEDGPTFFVMEYLEGEDLARTLAREGPLPWPRALHITAQIARALAAAHQRGVVHRDIKPQNCLRVARDGDPDFIKVLDFGLAKVLSATHKSAWTVGGSPGYIAPEIYRGGRTDHRVDIYALGVVLHTLLLGRLPAQSPSDVELPPQSPVLHASDLPAPLRAVIDRATAEDPERRYPTAEAMLAALVDARAAVVSASGHVQPDIFLKEKTPRRSARRGLLLLASAGGALTVALAIASMREAAGDPPLVDPASDRDASTPPIDTADAPASGAAQSPPKTASAPSSPALDASAPPPPAPNAGASAPSSLALDAADADASAPPSPGPDVGAPPSPAADASASASSSPAPDASAGAPPSPADASASTPSPPGPDALPTGAPSSTASSAGAPSSPDASAPSDMSSTTGISGHAPNASRPGAPRPPFDEAAARALLDGRAAAVRACKAGSSFRNIATTVKIDGTLTVSARGKATVALPPGYDVNPCLERLVAGLRFRPSRDGGAFTYTFQL